MIKTIRKSPTHTANFWSVTSLCKPIIEILFGSNIIGMNAACEILQQRPADMEHYRPKKITKKPVGPRPHALYRK